MKLAYRVRRDFETASGTLRIGDLLDPEQVHSWPNHKSLESAGFIVVAAAEEGTTAETTTAKGKRK